MTQPDPQHRNVGVVVVHGIGEEKRFEHLDDRVRKLTAALTRQAGQEGRTTSVEVLEADASSLFATSATWDANREPSVVLRLSAANPAALHPAGAETAMPISIWFHEVWWADINDAPGVRRDISFWIWALTVWFVPDMQNSNSSVYAENMIGPAFPKGQRPWLALPSLRLKLFLACCIAVLATTSITLVFQIAKRVFNIDLTRFKMIETFVAYLACIKIYAQEKRYGGNPLDGLDEAPRFAIRRRMVRTIVDVALKGYDAWYVLAHSMGSVIAFNGLMEADSTLVNYLDRDRFERAQAAFGAAPNANPPPDARLLPHRPVYVPPGARIDRNRLFAQLGGLLTYGSPLDKFAAIWPAKVPINIDEAPLERAAWFNVYDPTDPVGHELVAFGSVGTVGFAPRNICYAASPVFLESHQCYFNDAAPDALAAAVLRWIEGDRQAALSLLAADATRRIAIPAARWRSSFGYAQALLFFAAFAVFSIWSTTWLVNVLRPETFALMASILNVTHLHPLVLAGWPEVCSRMPQNFSLGTVFDSIGHALSAIHVARDAELVPASDRGCAGFLTNAGIVATFALFSIPLLVLCAGVIRRVLMQPSQPHAAPRSNEAYAQSAADLETHGLAARRQEVRGLQARGLSVKSR